jgi:hypothetical protein
MKKSTFLIAAILLITMSVNAQHEKIELSEICYFEEIEREVKSLKIKPYTYHKRLELKFSSGYQITIKEEDKNKLLSIIERFDEFDKQAKEENNNSPQIIDSFSPEAISFTKKVMDPSQMIKIYYCKELKETKANNGNLIIKIPELKDMFGGATAPEKYIYFSKSCVKELQNILK